MSAPEHSPSGPADLVFVGGTGRSGTHILSYLLNRHSRFYGVPIECRFHCNPKGLADVVRGRAEPEDFIRKLRGYWWHRVRVGDRAYVRAKWRALGRGRERGLHAIMDADRFGAAASRFEREHGDDLVGASRNLFYDLLQPLADRAGKPILVEMSCFTIAAADGLAEIFPEARFVHSVRDGRDSGSSKVSLRQKPHHPTDVDSGIEFWADRLRQAEDGVRGLSAADRERLRVISLDELVRLGPGGRLRRAARLPRRERRAGGAGVLRGRDELRRRAPRALAHRPLGGRTGVDRRALRGDPGAARGRGLPLRAGPAPLLRAHAGRIRALTEPPAPGDRPRILFTTSNGTGLGHLTRSMAIARRLGPSAEPLVPHPVGRRAGGRAHGLPGGVRRLVHDPRFRQRLPLVAPPARAPAGGDPRGRARPDRLRRHPSLRGAARGTAVERNRGLVPAAAVEARREPGAAQPRGRLRCRARAGRARRVRGRGPDGGAARARPPSRPDRAAGPRRAARPRHRGGPNWAWTQTARRCWSRSARGPRCARPPGGRSPG